MEAAWVLPLLLMTVLSMITLLLFFLHSLQAQVKAQDNALEASLDCGAIFKVIREEDTTWEKMQGTVKFTMVKNYEVKCYVVNAAEGIRLGKTFMEKEGE